MKAGVEAIKMTSGYSYNYGSIYDAMCKWVIYCSTSIIFLCCRRLFKTFFSHFFSIFFKVIKQWSSSTKIYVIDGVFLVSNFYPFSIDAASGSSIDYIYGSLGVKNAYVIELRDNPASSASSCPARRSYRPAKRPSPPFWPWPAKRIRVRHRGGNTMARLSGNAHEFSAAAIFLPMVLWKISRFSFLIFLIITLIVFPSFVVVFKNLALCLTFFC